MTTEEMVKDFTEQLKEQKGAIADLEEALKARREQVLRLQGAVEALNMTLKQAEATEESE
tara:strand:+ start:4726 stop:4905 length:180 start_codon:yes stop_codon:yes gene_type:complete